MMTTVSATVAAAGKVDVSDLHGASRWVVSLYNDHRLLYAFLTVAVLWTAGMLLGVGIEFLLGLLGRETERLDLNE